MTENKLMVDGIDKNRVEGQETFYIMTKEVVTKDGNKFLGYDAFIGPKRKRIQLKFRRECKDIPQEDGYLTVLHKDMNVSTSKQYPELWVKAVHKFVSRESEEESTQRVQKFFDDLPF